MTPVKNPTVEPLPHGTAPPDYHSVEVSLDTLQLAYQFKLWRSDHNCLFFIIKENSAILPQLKIGHIIPMKYYGSNALQHSEVRKTQIHNIINEKNGRFKGHHRVELAILGCEADRPAEKLVVNA